jgi:hypothetical protein
MYVVLIDKAGGLGVGWPLASSMLPKLHYQHGSEASRRSGAGRHVYETVNAHMHRNVECVETVAHILVGDLPTTQPE